MNNSLLEKLGTRLALFLAKPLPGYELFSSIPEPLLLASLQPGDLLLVEGNTRISTAIKYLTQSTWSHVCLYVGNQPGAEHPLVEADLIEGVSTVPLSKYGGHNLRICRPVNLSEKDQQQVINFAIERLGHQYDIRNVIDLMRYLIPTPPVPTRFRRRLLGFGSGDPTKAICSTLVAQAFQSVQYPILPREVPVNQGQATSEEEEKVLKRKHYSHFTPRDFDLSPYFKIIKPTIENSFDYRKLKWSDS